MTKALLYLSLILLGAFGMGARAHSEAFRGVGEGPRDAWSSFLSTVPLFQEITVGGDLGGSLPYLRNESAPMVPASVLKMVTAASAFKNLGSTARFENYFEAQFANQTASQIKFTVSGDPTWGLSEYESFDQRMNQVIAELQSKNITEVTGDVTIVSTRPELDLVARPSGWPARWLTDCMATMPSTFMIGGNCGSFRVLSTTLAEWKTAGVDLPIQFDLRPGNSNDFVVTPTQDDLQRIVGYTVSGKFHRSADVDSVPVYFGTRWLKNLFIASLASHGIKYSPNGDQVTGQAILVDISSLPLVEVLKVAVQNSVNAVLDRTYFEIAHVKNLQNGSDASFEILREVVGDESLIDGISISDGCGLVVDDRLRADTLKQFLANLKTQDYFSDYLSVLAVAGESGTLANRLTGPLTRGKVFAKTGTIDDFYNLAGYFQTPAQTLEPFVIFTSSNKSVDAVRETIDSVVTEFARINQ